jgi:hypothetical protein
LSLEVEERTVRLKRWNSAIEELLKHLIYMTNQCAGYVKWLRARKSSFSKEWEIVESDAQGVLIKSIVKEFLVYEIPYELLSFADRDWARHIAEHTVADIKLLSRCVKASLSNFDEALLNTLREKRSFFRQVRLSNLENLKQFANLLLKYYDEVLDSVESLITMHFNLILRNGSEL